MSKDLAKDVEQGGGEWRWCRNGVPVGGPMEAGQTAGAALAGGPSRERISAADWQGVAAKSGALNGATQVTVNWLGAREQLTHAIADLTREAERGMTAAELAADLAVLRDSLPAVLSPAADRALARLCSDAAHVRRGLR